LEIVTERPGGKKAIERPRSREEKQREEKQRASDQVKGTDDTSFKEKNTGFTKDARTCEQ